MNMYRRSYRVTIQATASTYVSCSHVAFLKKFKFSVTDSFFVSLWFTLCFQTGPFSLRSPPLTTYNQQLWLIAQMQAEHSNSKRAKMSHKQLHTLLLYNTLHFCCMFVGGVVFLFIFFSSVLCFLLFLSVGDFKQPFEISVEMKGVMQDASVVQINKAQPKSRMLHCASVSVKPQFNEYHHSFFFSFQMFWIWYLKSHLSLSHLFIIMWNGPFLLCV